MISRGRSKAVDKTWQFMPSGSSGWWGSYDPMIHKPTMVRDPRSPDGLNPALPPWIKLLVHRVDAHFAQHREAVW